MILRADIVLCTRQLSQVMETQMIYIDLIVLVLIVGFVSMVIDRRFIRKNGKRSRNATE